MFALCFSSAFTCSLRMVQDCSQRNCIISLIQIILENVGHIFGNSLIFNTDVPKPVCFHDDPQHLLICFSCSARNARQKTTHSCACNTGKDNTGWVTSSNRCTQTNINHVLPAHSLETSNVSLKTLLAFIHRSIFRATHVHMLGISDSLPVLLAASRTGRPRRQRQHCFALSQTLEHSERPREMYRPNAIDSRRSTSSFMLFSTSSFVSLYAIH